MRSILHKSPFPFYATTSDWVLRSEAAAFDSAFRLKGIAGDIASKLASHNVTILYA